jgi:hypothetical protein
VFRYLPVRDHEATSQPADHITRGYNIPSPRSVPAVGPRGFSAHAIFCAVLAWAPACGILRRLFGGVRKWA